MSGLLQIAFGPVQDFILTARRSRDLFAGSRLLSEIAASASEFLAGKVGYENLIFPAPSNFQDLTQLRHSGVSNIVLARIPDNQAPQQLAEAAIAAAQNYLATRAKGILQQHQASLAFGPALQQIDDLLEAYWTWVPIQHDYSQARNRLGAVMAARKNTRDFRAVSWGSSAPKSSLDGARESVIHQVSPQWQLQNGIRQGEQLSGVDLIKRLWPERNFLSTSHLAALPYYEGLKQHNKLQQLEFYLERLASQIGQAARVDWAHPVVRETLFARYDPRLLFEGRLAEFFSEPNTSQEQQARATLSEMYKTFGQPYPYYTLLHADGDRMGEAIDHQSQTGEVAGHRKLSNQLALEFAAKVYGLVERHQGCLVYAGGDDVLALLPLHTALRCARALANVFQTALKGFGKKQDPTLSVGLAIVHHLEPLQDALELARRTEKLAKEGTPGTPQPQKRNALAVAFSPRSGSELLLRGRWDEQPALGQRLYRYQDLVRLEQIPSKAAYELKRLVAELSVAGMEEALVAEAKRILGRKEMQREYQQELDQRLHTPQDVAQLANELLLARALAKAYQLAGVPRESREVYDAH